MRGEWHRNAELFIGASMIGDPCYGGGTARTGPLFRRADVLGFASSAPASRGHGKKGSKVEEG
jgi:hypothetical protein